MAAELVGVGMSVLCPLAALSLLLLQGTRGAWALFLLLLQGTRDARVLTGCSAVPCGEHGPSAILAALFVGAAAAMPAACARCRWPPVETPGAWYHQTPGCAGAASGRRAASPKGP